MKNVIALLLIAIFAFNFGGNFVILKIQKHQLRKEVKRRIKAGIPENELTLIEVTAKNASKLQWKNEEEFLYEGEFYDIVHQETTEHSTVYHTLPDTKEHKLIEKFLEKLKKNPKNKNRTSGAKYFKIVLRLPPSQFQQEYLSFEKVKEAFFNYNPLYYSVDQDISTPPPKLV